MSYIGNQAENKVSPARMREYVTGDGSATTFDLSHDIPGYGAENLIVVVNNVIQEPASAYTITNDANGRPRRLDFGAGNVLATTDTCYVIYQATGQLYHTPPANSVGYSQLEANLRSGRVDQFAGSAGASSNTVFTLTETALNANNQTNIAKAMSDAESFSEKLSKKQVELGLSQNRISNRLDIIDEKTILYKDLMSKSVDTDYTEAITKLSANMLALEAAQSTFAKVSQLSLFNYM